MANDLVPKDVAEGVFNLPALPKELRLMIYEYVLSVGKIHLAMKRDLPYPHDEDGVYKGKISISRNIDVAILRASRHTHEEAVKALYSLNTFIFDFQTFKSSRVQGLFFRRIGKINQGYLRDIMLILHGWDLWDLIRSGLRETALLWNPMPRHLDGFYMALGTTPADPRVEPVLLRNLMVNPLSKAEFKEELGLSKPVVGGHGVVGVLRENVKIDYEGGFRELGFLEKKSQRLDGQSWGPIDSKVRVIVPFGSPSQAPVDAIEYHSMVRTAMYRETEVLEAGNTPDRTYMNVKGRL